MSNKTEQVGTLAKALNRTQLCNKERQNNPKILTSKCITWNCQLSWFQGLRIGLHLTIAEHVHGGEGQRQETRAEEIACKEPNPRQLRPKSRALTATQRVP